MIISYKKALAAGGIPSGLLLLAGGALLAYSHFGGHDWTLLAGSCLELGAIGLIATLYLTHRDANLDEIREKLKLKQDSSIAIKWGGNFFSHTQSDESDSRNYLGDKKRCILLG